jgi:hypothetical protein
VPNYIDSLEPKGLDTRSLVTDNLELGSIGLPAARMLAFARYLFRAARKLLRSIIARIDLSQFPGSCCG